jgi:hypothetical protein
MGRLEDVRLEIEQLCEEIEQDALRSRGRPPPNFATPPNTHVSLQLFVPKDTSHRLRISISMDQDDDHP